MLSDPLTIPSPTFAFDASWPTASETLMQGKAFNGIEIGPGAKSRRAFSPATLATLVLAKGELSVSHASTTSGRKRSVIRVDVGKLDALLGEHTAAAYLVLDREATLTADGIVALQRALSGLLLLLVTGTGSGAVSTTSIMTEFLNGEA